MDATIDRLQIEIESNAGNASSGLDKLIKSMERLQAATGSGNAALQSVSSSLSNMSSAMNSLNSTTGLDKLSAALSDLKGKTGSLTSIANSMKKLNEINLGDIGTQLSDFSRHVSSLSNLGDSLQSIRDFGKGITSLSNSMKKLNEMDIDAVSGKIKSLVEALKPLTDEMIRAGSGMSNFGTQMKDLSQAMRTMNNMGTLTNQVKNGLKSVSETTASTEKKISSLSSTLKKGLNLGKLTAGLYAVKRLASGIGDAISNMNSYIEDVNLFTVAMGEAADRGAEFAQRMEDVLGIDSGEAMRNMGLFNNLTESFGVASDQAEKLSKNMTQLGYDFASFYNLPTEEAFTKLQAAISGELEPIRRLGIDISQTRLQQELMNLGINESVSNLSQADKAVLRYIAIMKQSGNAQGDFARTLNTPANMLRVFQAQVSLAARAIGSLFIPALTAILPPAIAVVKVITSLISVLAGFLGFEMPEINFDADAAVSFGTGLEDVSDGLDDVGSSASSAAKEVAQLIGGFDELNVLSAPSTGGGGGGAGGGAGMGNLLDGIEIPEYDMFAQLVNSDVEKWVKRLEGPLENILKLAGLVGAAFLAWKLSNSFLDGIEGLQKLLKGVAGGSQTRSLKQIAGAMLTLAGAASYLYGAGKELVDGFVSWEGMLSMLGGSAGMIAGMTLAFGKMGGAITAVVSGLGMYVLGLKDLASGNASVPAVTQTILGLASAAGGLAVVLGSGGAGVAVGVVGGLIALGAAIYGVRQKAARAELESRFGDITLSLEELQDIAEKVVSSQYLEKVGVILEDISKVNASFDGLKNITATMDNLTIQAEVFGSLNAEESAQLKEAIDQYIAQAQEYVSGLKETVPVTIAVGLEPIGGTDNPFVQGILALANYSIENMQNELDNLGLELGELYMNAMADGIIDADEEAAIAELQKKYQRMLDAASNAEYEATLNQITFEAKATGLTAESFLELSEQLSEAASNQVIEVRNAAVEMSAFTIQAMAGLDISDSAREELNRLISNVFSEAAEIENANIVLQSASVQLNTMKEAFGEELSRIAPALQNEMDNNSDLQNVLYNMLNFPGEMNSETLGYQMQNAVEAAYVRLNAELGSLATESGLTQKMVDSLAPTQEQLESIRDNFINLGIQVPQGVKDGLSDIEMTQAMMGDMSAIYSMLGKQLAESNPEVVELLKTSKEFAQSIPIQMAEGIAAEYDLVFDAGEGVYKQLQLSSTGQEMQALVDLLNANGGEIANAIPDEILSSMGLIRDSGTNLVSYVQGGIEDAFPDAQLAAQTGTEGVVEAVTGTVTGNLETVKSTSELLGTNVSDGVQTGIEAKEPSLLQRLGNWCTSIINKLAGVDGFDTHSPSKKTYAIGGYLAEGLADGLEGKTSIFGRLSNWADSVIRKIKEKFEVHSPSRVFRDEIGLNLGLGIASGLDASIPNVLESIDSMNAAMQDSFKDESRHNVFARGFIDVDDTSVEDSIRRYQSAMDANSNISATYSNEGNYELVAAIVEVGQAIVEAIEENGDRPISISKRDIGRAAVGYINEQTMQTGRSPVKQ